MGLDNINNVRLKEYRLNRLSRYPNFVFVKGNIADAALVGEMFEKYVSALVVNLAAQA